MDFDSPEAETAMRQQVADLVRVYLDAVPKDEKPLAVEVAAEAPLVDPFTGEDLGMPMVGVLDLVLGQRCRADHHGLQDGGPQQRTDGDHATRSSSRAMPGCTGRSPDSRRAGWRSAVLIKTKVPKCEFHPYAARTDAHFRRLFAVLREYLDALDGDTFNFRPGFGCGMCDFRNTHCSRWAG